MAWRVAGKRTFALIPTFKSFMSLKNKLLLLLLCLYTGTVSAQLHYGFKTGLNFAHMDGPSEQDAAGKSLESWKNTTGFHIGTAISYHFTDNFGARVELLYSKKGTKYTYDGTGYRLFTQPNGTEVRSNGNIRYLLNVNNSYLDIPVVGYARFGAFEVQAGVYGALNVQSVADGSLTFEDKESVILPAKLEFNLDYNYRKDDPKEGKSSEEVTVTVKGKDTKVPKTLGAYYDFPEDRGHLYNAFDYGLIGGVSYYLSHTLYVNVRLQYGLADLTRNNADLNRSTLGANNALIFSEDKDRNFTVQASVGFSF